MVASYEESRQQRLEENKKRMEELNLLKLSNSLKPSPGKVVKPKSSVRKAVDVVLTAVRRSTRMADKPKPDYKEGLIEAFGSFRRVSYRRSDFLNRKYAPYELRMKAIEQAESLEVELGSEFPTFVKPMLQSHVTGGFWLGLPHKFCSTYMPEGDVIFILEDEEGNESECKYLGKKNGLSGGWRGFAIDHELVDGDSVVFQLVKPTKFKVYLIRFNELNNENDEDVDGDTDVEMPNSEPETKPEKVAKPSPGKRRSTRRKSSRM